MIINPNNTIAIHQDHVVSVRKSGKDTLYIETTRNGDVFTYKNETDRDNAFEAILRTTSPRLDPLYP